MFASATTAMARPIKLIGFLISLPGMKLFKPSGFCSLLSSHEKTAPDEFR